MLGSLACAGQPLPPQAALTRATRTSSRRSTDRLKAALQIDVSRVQATTRRRYRGFAKLRVRVISRDKLPKRTRRVSELSLRVSGEANAYDVLDDRRARRTSLARALSLGFELAAKYLGAGTTGLTRRIAALPKSQILNDSSGARSSHTVATTPLPWIRARY